MKIEYRDMGLGFNSRKTRNLRSVNLGKVHGGCKLKEDYTFCQHKGRRTF